MTITLTSVRSTNSGGEISTVGEMGEHGRVFTTYTLKADSGGMAPIL